MCLVLNALALVLNEMSEKLGCIECGGWGVFIAPTTKTAVGEVYCRRVHRTVRCTTRHCLVRQPRHLTVRVLTVSIVGALTSWCTGQSGAAPERHCSLSGAPSGAALTSARAGAHCSLLLFRCRRPLALCSRYSAGTPDSPVLHRTVR